MDLYRPRAKPSHGKNTMLIVGISIAVAVVIAAIVTTVVLVEKKKDKKISGGGRVPQYAAQPVLRGGGSYSDIASDMIAQGAADDVMYGIKGVDRKTPINKSPFEDKPAPAPKSRIIGEDEVPEWVSLAATSTEDGAPTAKEMYLAKRDGYLRGREFNVAEGTSDFGFGQGVTEADDEREANALASIAASMDATGGLGMGGQKRPEIEAVKEQLRAAAGAR